MRFWVVKGTAARNDFARDLRKQRVETWVTKAPPSRSWCEGDAVFVWESSPGRRVVGLAEIASIQRKPRAGVTTFELRYLSGFLPRPLELAALRRMTGLGEAAFLKAGPARTVLAISDSEAHVLARAIAKVNSTTVRVVTAWTVHKVKAISIRQPYVEQILRGTKTAEYRSTPTNVRGKVYLYAALKPADDEANWLAVRERPGALPTGRIIGTVEITGCRRDRQGGFAYELANPDRWPRKDWLVPSKQPQPRWFYPF